MTPQRPRRAALYLRISLDATGEQLAIKRQRELCENIVTQRGWDLAGVYEDNSISASDARKKRSGYDALVSAYEAGQFDALICYDMDRLTRQPRQMEDWLDAAEAHGLALVTANGEADLTTDAGRTFVRVRMAFARGEVERKSARQRAAARQRAKLGRPPLGTRLTGYTARGETVPEEAEVVRRIFAMFSAGESLRMIARTLTSEGVPTHRARKGLPTDGQWNPTSITTILTNPRYAGRAIYQGEVMTDTVGNWEPLVDEDVFDLVQARLSDPRRKTNRAGTDRKHLGSGLYICADCGQPCTSFSNGRYRCKQAHVNRSMPQVDSFVRDVIAERLRQPDVADLLTPATEDLTPLLEEYERLRIRLVAVESDYDAGLIDGRRFASANESIHAELAAVQQKMAVADRGTALGEVLGSEDPATEFLAAGIMRQRVVIGALATVRLHRGKRGSRSFDPQTVEIDWATV